MKRCNGCSTDKPLSDFYDKHKTTDGLSSRCKPCTIELVKKRRRNDDKVREYDRARGSRRTHDMTRAYREKNPAAYAAHTAVGNAVRDGKLKREPCLFCLAERVQGHHRDYTKPLDVVWLCARCHHRLHAYFPETCAHEKT